MRDVNKVILIGRVGKDPDVKTFDSGTKNATFSFATGESWKDRDGNKQNSTEWHNIVAWRKPAEIVEKYVKKGDPLYIEGKLRTRSYEDKDGNKRYITEIQLITLSMLGSRETSSRPPANESEPPKEPNEPDYDDDLPF